MSTPESSTETPDLETTDRARQDTLTQSVGTRLAVPEAKAPWWKRMLGRG
jgi:hypothetical protein